MILIGTNAFPGTQTETLSPAGAESILDASAVLPNSAPMDVTTNAPVEGKVQQVFSLDPPDVSVPQVVAEPATSARPVAAPDLIEGRRGAVQIAVPAPNPGFTSAESVILREASAMRPTPQSFDAETPAKPRDVSPNTPIRAVATPLPSIAEEIEAPGRKIPERGFAPEVRSNGPRDEPIPPFKVLARDASDEAATPAKPAIPASPTFRPQAVAMGKLQTEVWKGPVPLQRRQATPDPNAMSPKQDVAPNPSSRAQAPRGPDWSPAVEGLGLVQKSDAKQTPIVPSKVFGTAPKGSRELPPEAAPPGPITTRTKQSTQTVVPVTENFVPAARKGVQISFPDLPVSLAGKSDPITSKPMKTAPRPLLEIAPLEQERLSRLEPRPVQPSAHNTLRTPESLAGKTSVDGAIPRAAVVAAVSDPVQSVLHWPRDQRANEDEPRLESKNITALDQQTRPERATRKPLLAAPQVFAHSLPIEGKPDMLAQMAESSGQAGVALDERAQAASSSTVISPKTAPQPQVVIHQIAGALHELKSGPIEVSLSPEELGRVRLSLQSAETAVTVLITAERPETLDLLRRNIDLLAVDLQEIGYEDMSFAFGNPGSQNEQAPSEPSHQANEADTGQWTAHPLIAQNVAAAGGLDIRI